MILDTDASLMATVQTQVSCVEHEPKTWLWISSAQDGSLQTERLQVRALWFKWILWKKNVEIFIVVPGSLKVLLERTA